MTTRRLHLMPVTAEHVAGFLRDREELGRLIGARVPESWPVFPETFPFWIDRLREDPSLVGWAGWMFILKNENALVGDGGFKGKPDSDGAVEIGYAIVPDYRRRGVATEAARGLIDWAFSHTEVRRVRVETLEDSPASMAVPKKLGMRLTCEAFETEDGRVLRWEIGREAYGHLHNKSNNGCHHKVHPSAMLRAFGKGHEE